MSQMLIEIGDDVNVDDFSAQLKDLFPSLRIIHLRTDENKVKLFKGTDDLERLHVSDFKMFKREELYDR